MDDTWLGSSVVVKTTDKDWSGKLLSSNAIGVVIEVVRSTPASAPFEGIDEESTLEVFIPLFRIVHCVRGRHSGIS